MREGCSCYMKGLGGHFIVAQAPGHICRAPSYCTDVLLQVVVLLYNSLLISRPGLTLPPFSSCNVGRAARQAGQGREAAAAQARGGLLAVQNQYCRYTFDSGCEGVKVVRLMTKVARVLTTITRVTTTIVRVMTKIAVMTTITGVMTKIVGVNDYNATGGQGRCYSL